LRESVPNHQLGGFPQAHRALVSPASSTIWHSWHGSPPCLGGAEQSTPEARRGALARGVDGKSARQAIMVMPLMLASRGPPPLRFLGFGRGRLYLFSRRTFSNLTASPRRSPPYRLCDALAASTYIRSGLSPYQGPSCNIARGKRGAPRRMGPIFITAYCSHTCSRSRIHLGLVCSFIWRSRLPHEWKGAKTRPLRRRPSAPDQSRDSATEQSTACAPLQRL
jgi:hypothetical protein